MIRDLFGNSIESSPTKLLGRRDHLTFRGNVSSGRHGWLRLTPAYSLHVVSQLLEGNSEQRILDPFSGTGTTPLASSIAGIPCDAVDINPFLVWLGNLKISQFGRGTSDKIREKSQEIAARITNGSNQEQYWVPEIHMIEKWWDADILKTLSHLYHEIVQRNDSIGSLLKIAFCRVMIQNAHVSFSHQSMSFKQPASHHDRTLGLVAPQSTESRLAEEFLSVAEDIASSVESDRPLAPAHIYVGDSRDLRAVLSSEKYTKVVTSPPYPNRMSYIRELRPYMYWLGFLTSGNQAGKLDWQAIGGTWGTATSSLNTWRASDSVEVPYAEFSRIVNAIHQKHPILARYVHRYFEDMTCHILNLRQVLAPGAICHYVVGNSKFYDTLVPVEHIFASQFHKAGFSRVRIETLRKRTSKKELFEYIVHAEL